MTEFELSHLISKRAAARNHKLFAESISTDDAPKGFQLHPKRLALDYGMPNQGFFPIDSLDVKVIDYPFQTNDVIPHTNTSLESLSLSGGTRDSAVEGRPYSKGSIKTTRHTNDKKIISLAEGLQYSQVDGLAQLRQFCTNFIAKVHKPAFDNWNIIITQGAGDGLNKGAEAFLDKDDVILVEEFTFTPFLYNVKEKQAISVPIKLAFSHKSNGIDLEYLENLLENWETLRPGLRRPKMLYTIPTGQNPTGLTQSLEFRKKVYSIAEKFDFIILEDDPYGYLALAPFHKPEGIVRLNEFVTPDEYIEKHLAPSYLEIDSNGRVIRVETFSKLFAPGMRLGFVVAHKKVTDIISHYSSVVTRNSSGVSQILANNVIQQKFGGVDGWINWILSTRVVYTHRKDTLLNVFFESEAYKKGYLDIVDPSAGMFAALIINFPKGTDVPAKIKLLNYKFLHYGVNVVKGINMAVDPEFSESRCNFFRLCFAPQNDDGELIEGASRISNAVFDFFEKGLEF